MTAKLGPHINDWSDLNLVRSRPNVTLIHERIKHGAEQSILDIWHKLDATMTPGLLVECVSTCHNDCPYCPSGTTIPNEFEISDFARLISTLKSRGLISVWLTGGEPLHDIERFSCVLDSVRRGQVDVERISTSLVTIPSDLERFIGLANECGRSNRWFKCTVAIGLNSFVRNSISLSMPIVDRLAGFIRRLDSDATRVHIPVIVDEPNGTSVVELATLLKELFPDIGVSLKCVIPRVDEFDTIPSESVSECNLARYMDCGKPSLFPCTWPMWHLTPNGDLYCCSTWFHDRKSANYLGNITVQEVALKPSQFMANVCRNGGWLPTFNQLSTIAGSSLLEMRVPRFDDNTQKCLVCREMMRLYSTAVSRDVR